MAFETLKLHGEMSSPTEELAGASLAELGARLVLGGESETPHREKNGDAWRRRAQTCEPTPGAPQLEIGNSFAPCQERRETSERHFVERG